MFILDLAIRNHMLDAIGGNPMSKARAATALLSDAQAEMSRLQAQSAAAASTGAPRDPELISKMARVAAIIGMAYQFFKEAVDQQKRDQESLAATNKLAEPAR